MEIKVPQQLEQHNISGDFNSIEAGMDNSSLPFILEMLSKNFYSNPIGSICREITSNCFDSHIEAGVDEPVIIKIDNDDEGDYISFTDVGAGLSPERIKKIYMKYFTSTKRSTNDQIGGFGLGSKTPLSYQDYFYITTIFENIKYSYLFSKGQTLPTLDLLIEQPIEQHNGTEIKIYIKNNNDKMRFKNELKSQLSYFDNVYFINCGIDNEYIIYENDLFKFRNKNQYSDEMHICFGKVSYPIDWNRININCVDVPIGIKFSISELEVVPNREALLYTDKVTDLVRTRVLESIAKLKEIYIQQQNTYDNFFEWYKHKSKEKYIRFGDSEDKLQLKGNEFRNIGKETNLKILEELKFNDSIFGNDIYYILYKSEYYIDIDKTKKYYNSNNLTNDLLNYSSRYVFSTDSNFSNVKNYYHKRSKILQRSNIRVSFKTLLNGNGFVKEVEITKEIKKHINNTIELNNNYNIINNHSYFKTIYFDLGLSIRIYKLIKYLREQIEPILIPYHQYITEEFKQEYKDFQNKTDNNKRRKIEGKVFCKGINHYIDWDWKLQEIEQFTGIVIYGFTKDKKALEKAVTFCYLNPKFRNRKLKNGYYTTYEEDGTINLKTCKIIQIAQSNEKHFKNRNNMIHVDQLYSDNKLFRKLASSYRIEILLGQYLKNYTEYKNEDFIKFIKNINENVGNAFEELYKYYKEFTSEDIKYTRIVRKDLKNDIIQIAEKGNWFDITIESKIKIVEDYFSGIELLKHIDFNNETLPAILIYLRQNKKKLNLEYYRKIIPEPEKTGVELEFDFTEKLEEPIEIITKFRQLTA